MLTLEQITTDRLVLEPLDRVTARAVVDGTPSGLSTGDGWPHEDTRDGLGMALRHGHAPGWLILLDGVVIGDCGIHGDVDALGEVELGYGLAAPYRGHGYGSELVVAAAGWLRARPGVRRVVAHGVLPDNVASRRALERAGFRCEAERAEGVDYALAAGLADHFGPQVAARYDADEGMRPDSTMIDRLVTLAAGRPALELAIGTGRVALPLAAAGVQVHGIELSEAMVAQLRSKPGGAEIPVTLGDMATARVGDGFGLVYLVFNTIGNLCTQDAQVACFANAAAHLAPGGAFVVESGVPGLRGLAPGETTRVFDHSPAHVGIDEYAPASQGLVSHHWTPGAGWTQTPLRYTWPAELDLMARLAGMTLSERHADWAGSPFTDDAESHVSVWVTCTSG